MDELRAASSRVGDWTLWAECLSEDAEFVNVVGLWWHDRDAIADAHGYALGSFFAETELRPGATRVKRLSNDHAIVQCRFRLTGQRTPDGRTAAERRTILTFVVERRTNGWIAVAAQNTDVAEGAETLARDRDGALRAMSNVCRHRMSILLEGRGHVRAITCPYHAWTYNLDGSLRGAPAMDMNTSFCKEASGLPAVRCVDWKGWIMVTLDPDLPEPHELLKEMDDLVGYLPMEDYVEVFREEHRWNTNWKILAENFMESYHLPMCHGGTIGGAVLFSIFFSVVNTMMITGRQRLQEAGILQALGFRPLVSTTLLVFEGLIISLIGGGGGILLQRVGLLCRGHLLVAITTASQG